MDVNECDLNPNICLHGECENTKGSFICHCQLGYFVKKGTTGCTGGSSARLELGLPVRKTGKPPWRQPQPGVLCGACCGMCWAGTQCQDTPVPRCWPSQEPALPPARLPGLSSSAPAPKPRQPLPQIPGSCASGISPAQPCCSGGAELGQPWCPSSADIDECEIGAHNCDMHASCINVPGSFKCKYLDECATEEHKCNLNANCVNTPGSYRCACRDGFNGDGFSCSGEAQGHELQPPSRGWAPSWAPRGWQRAAPSPVSLPADVDECADNVNLCENGQCLNAPGGYRCECEMGFNPTEDSKACQGECPGPEPLLGLSGLCWHLPLHEPAPSTCWCQAPEVPAVPLDHPGVGWSQLGRRWEQEQPVLALRLPQPVPSCPCFADIDECTFQNICVFGTCQNLPGMFRCACDDGYELDRSGGNCTGQGSGLCWAHPWQPESSPWSLWCPCCWGGPGAQLRWHRARVGIHLGTELGLGWAFLAALTSIFSVHLSVLSDINECADPVNCINGLCVNTPGSYLCNCPQDFELNPTGVGCVGEWDPTQTHLGVLLGAPVWLELDTTRVAVPLCLFLAWLSPMHLTLQQQQNP
ncbi:hypothetical protein EK904_001396 [Melospiza melodia maxima]|nr:hypothetical protein EK904_001396 [Melospiza melodia maxima]